jgi:hypothetical protein
VAVFVAGLETPGPSRARTFPLEIDVITLRYSDRPGSLSGRGEAGA